MSNPSVLDKYPVLMSDDQKFARRKKGFEDYELYVPYGLLMPHENQARENHCGQSLARMKERGGLSYAEMLAIIEDRRWKHIPDDTARALVLMKVHDYLVDQSELDPYWSRVKSTIYTLMTTCCGIDTWQED